MSNSVIFVVFPLFQVALIYNLKWLMTYWFVRSFWMHCYWMFVINWFTSKIIQNGGNLFYDTRTGVTRSTSEQSRRLTETYVGLKRFTRGNSSVLRTKPRTDENTPWKRRLVRGKSGVLRRKPEDCRSRNGRPWMTFNISFFNPNVLFNTFFLT